MNPCPYCLDEIESAEGRARCDSCGAEYHAECWDENGGCCVKDCPAVTRNLEIDLPEETPEHLELSRESVESAAPHSRRKVSNPCMGCGRQVRQGQLYCPECTPERDGNPDSRNVGPLLVMLLIAALLAAVLYLLKVESQPETSGPPVTVSTPSRVDK